MSDDKCKGCGKHLENRQWDEIMVTGKCPKCGKDPLRDDKPKGLSPELLAKLKAMYDEEMALQTAGSVKTGVKDLLTLEEMKKGGLVQMFCADEQRAEAVYDRWLERLRKAPGFIVEGNQRSKRTIIFRTPLDHDGTLKVVAGRKS